MTTAIEKVIQIAEESVESMEERRDSARSCGQNEAADCLDEMIEEAEAAIREARRDLASIHRPSSHAEQATVVRRAADRAIDAVQHVHDEAERLENALANSNKENG